MNPMLGPILGTVFGAAMRRRGMGGMCGAGGLGGGLGGAVLGGMLGGRRGPMGRSMGGRNALLLMLLPFAMRWVQNQGGMGAVLKKFQQRGYDRQARSWVKPGDNEMLDPQAVEQVVGHEELAQMAQRLGVPEQEVAQAFAEIVPEMVDQLTPQGQLDPQADEVLDEGRRTIEKEIQDVQFREVKTS